MTKTGKNTALDDAGLLASVAAVPGEGTVEESEAAERR